MSDEYTPNGNRIIKGLENALSSDSFYEEDYYSEPHDYKLFRTPPRMRFRDFYNRKLLFEPIK